VASLSTGETLGASVLGVGAGVIVVVVVGLLRLLLACLVGSAVFTDDISQRHISVRCRHGRECYVFTVVAGI
jgi:hypothetical protein